MTAETFSGERAHALGLVTEVSDVAAGRRRGPGRRAGRPLPGRGQRAKALFQRTWTPSPRLAFWTETVLQVRLLRGANHRIARDAALRREQPVFRDRSS